MQHSVVNCQGRSQGKRGKFLLNLVISLNRSMTFHAPLHFLIRHSPEIGEKNIAQKEAGLMKESLLSRSWIDETILC